MNRRVAVLTSVHPHDDVRIFHKEALTLRDAGYEVTIYNREFAGEKSGVRFVRVPVPESRTGRIAASWQAYAKAAMKDAPSICHLHDPELLPAGLLLRRQGAAVVYDAHEDLPKQIHGKDWIPHAFRNGAAWGAGEAESFVAKRLDLIVCATEPITNRFREVNPHVITLHNYPKLCEFPPPGGSARERAVCYVGGLSANRGVLQMAQAAKQAGIPLYLAGRFDAPGLERQMRSSPGVKYLGVLGRQEIAQLLGRCCAGLVMLHPTPAYVESIPIKMLEYLAAGTPALASDFPYWRELLRGIDCAVFGNPMDINGLAQTILALADDPAKALKMGLDGRRAVETRFCWERECGKLVRAYEPLLNRKTGR